MCWRLHNFVSSVRKNTTGCTRRQQWMSNPDFVFRNKNKIYPTDRGPETGCHEDQEGLRILSWPLEPVIDIVFVHGVSGGPETAWSTDHTFWPRDFLAKDIPDARIACWGYKPSSLDTAVLRGGEVAYLLADSFCSDMYEVGEYGSRPIVFIGVDLGGLLIQRGLKIAETGYRTWAREIMLSTHAALFMGVPATAAEQAVLIEKLTQQERRLLPGGSEPSALFRASRNGPLDDSFLRPLEDLARDFGEIASVSRLKIAYCNPTRNLNDLNSIYDNCRHGDESGTIRINAKILEIPGGHMEMTRFRSRSEVGYRRVLGQLREWRNEGFTRVPLSG